MRRNRTGRVPRPRAWRALACIAGLFAATGSAAACEAIVGIEEVGVTGGAGGAGQGGGGCEDASADSCPDDGAAPDSAD